MTGQFMKLTPLIVVIEKVGVLVGGAGVGVRVKVAVGEPTVLVRVGVAVVVEVGVGPQPGIWELVAWTTPQSVRVMGPSTVWLPRASVTLK